MKPLYCITGLFFLIGGLFTANVAAQSNDRIDELLLQSTARLDSTAYIVLAAGGQIAESDSPDIAIEKARALGLISKEQSAESPVKLQDLSLMLMKGLGLKGGVMYSLFPGTRYAYKELNYRKVIDGHLGPLHTVSGEEVIRTLGYATELKGGSK